MRQLILGGARSGKSHLAQARASALGQEVVYIATAESRDDEMRERIARHQSERPAEWDLLEVPLNLAERLQSLSGQGKTVLVDCLTFWLTNHLLQTPDDLPLVRQELVAAVKAFDGHLLLVSNEVGWGIIPMGELSRSFQDQAGWLHQELAAEVEQVTLTVAGIPLVVKGAQTDAG